MISTEIMRKRSEVLVIALVGKSAAPQWWDSPNKAFQYSTPEDIWQKSPGLVYEYVMKYSGGEYL